MARHDARQRARRASGVCGRVRSARPRRRRLASRCPALPVTVSDTCPTSAARAGDRSLPASSSIRSRAQTAGFMPSGALPRSLCATILRGGEPRCWARRPCRHAKSELSGVFSSAPVAFETWQHVALVLEGHTLTWCVQPTSGPAFVSASSTIGICEFTPVSVFVVAGTSTVSWTPSLVCPTPRSAGRLRDSHCACVAACAVRALVPAAR